MIAHYLAVALAKFRKAPLTTAANVLTLALGLAAFVAAYGISSWWRLADHQWARAASIYVIGEGFTGLYPAAPAPPSSATLARYLLQDVPEIELVARVQPRRPAPVAAGDEKMSLAAAVADPAFFEIFDFRFLEGDPSTALTDARAVVLTEAAAERLFGGEPALGRPVIVDGDREGVVTGVIAPARQPSFMGGDVLSFEMLQGWSSLSQPEEFESDYRWFSTTVYTFVTLPRTMSAESLNARLADLVRRRVPPEPEQAPVFEAFPATELMARELDRAMFAERPGLSAVLVLLSLGSLTLIVACVNYANLATAVAVGRAKEIGLRKVLGASRVEIMAQAWLEAALVVGVALAAAIAALALLAPAVGAATGIDILYALGAGVAPWGAVLALAAGVALAAGAYPALILSRVRPAEALEASESRTGPGWMAHALVGVQLGSASFLLILVTVIQLQRSYLEETALAPGEDPVIVLTELGAAGVDHETLAARLAGVPGVKSVSVVDARPWGLAPNAISFTRDPDPDAAESAPIGYFRGVGYDYFETIGLDLLAGRGFDRSIDTIPTPLFTDDPARVVPIVVDLTYAQRLGFPSAEAAVGQLVYLPAISNPRITRPTMTLRIIGVTEPDAAQLTTWLAEGNAFAYAPALPFTDRHPLVRIAREDIPSALAGVTRVWDELAPTVPADVRFVDDLFEQGYRRYALLGRLFTLVAGAAFAIASIGQLGIAIHVAARRRREMGIRKTLGATALGLARLLIVDFSKPALAANLLAWPVGYLAAQTYLAIFAERVPLTPAPFALSLAITLAIAWAAVFGEVLKAASVRPAEVLRHA